jgi:NAD(P)-dependent dehydrogenase (short-subunit alcohol dehydrogenase family)
MMAEDVAERESTAAAATPDEAGGTAPGRGRLAGRRILVVGGGQDDHGLDDPPIGNGRAMSVLFGREGAAVAVADLNGDSAEATARRVRDEGVEAATLVADAADEAASATMFGHAREALSGLDGVVMNVGIGAGFMLDGTTAEDWDRVMAVNLRSHFLGCKHALATMDECGAVVLVGSVAASEVMPLPAYAASKAALGSLARQAAVEGAPRIRVNLLVPGLIDTPLGRLASSLSPLRERVKIPARRQGTAWEVAYAALFLLSDESSYVTGQSLVVDGGLTIGPRA